METWTSRELPVLRLLVELLDDPERILPVQLPELYRHCDALSERDVRAALRSLSGQPPYVIGTSFAEAAYPVAISEVTERAFGCRARSRWRVWCVAGGPGLSRAGRAQLIR
jgi:hypothetical protein